MRFISPDGFEYIEPEYISGLNLYAYCKDDPVMHYDPSGCFWKEVWDWTNTILGLINPISKITMFCAITNAVLKGDCKLIFEDLTQGCFNPFNQDEDVVLKSQVLSFYKGCTVFRCNTIGNFSIMGTIWFKQKNNDYSLEHEYGHSIQERILGIYYLPNVAIPSITFAALTSVSPYIYFSTPWERMADLLSCINRKDGYKDYSLLWSVIENIFGPIVIPFYFMFGY